MNEFKKEAEKAWDEARQEYFDIHNAARAPELIIETALREAYEQGLEDAANKALGKISYSAETTNMLNRVRMDILSLKRPAKGESK